MVARRSLRVSAEAADPPAAPVRARACPLCARPLPEGPSVDLHHPVPKALGGTVTVPMHRICHRKLHATFTERELAAVGVDWAALRAHPEIEGFVRWVAKRPPAFYDGSRKTKRLRER